MAKRSTKKKSPTTRKKSSSTPDSKPEPAPPTGLDWRRLHLWQIQPVRDILVIAGVVGVLYLGYILSIVTVPILLALTFAYLFEPVVQRLTRLERCSRQLAAALLIALIALMIVVPVTLAAGFAVAQGAGFVSDVAQNLSDFKTSIEVESAGSDEEAARVQDPPDGWANYVPEYERDLRAGSDEASEESGEEETGEPAAEEPAEEPPPSRTFDAIAAYERMPAFWQEQSDWYLTSSEDSALHEAFDYARELIGNYANSLGTQAVGTGVDALTATVRAITSIGVLAFMAFLTAFFFFFFSTGYARVLEFGRGLIPDRKRERVIDLAEKMDRVIAGFVRGRITIAVIQSVIFTILYWIIGVPAPLILGPLVGFLSIVPYVALVGIPISVVLLWLEPNGGWQDAIWWTLGAPVGVYFLGQAVDDYVLTPVIQGKSTDMDTPSILFATLAGGALAGVYGLLLAIPVAACLKILLREVFWPRFHAWAEGRERDFLPFGDGDDQDEAAS